MLEYKKLIQKRNVWMALAILWVVFHHLIINFEMPSILVTFKSSGYGGVDIFLFASGIGCFYSLNKNSNAYEFLQRRFKRIMPTYLIFIVAWLIYKILIKSMSIPAIIGNLFCIEYFSNRNGMAFNWYICALWVFYLLAPYLFGLINRISNNIKLFVIGFLLLLISVPFWNYHNMIIVVTRLPIFFIGMCVARLSTEKEKLTKMNVTVVLAAMLVGIVLIYIFNKFFETYLWNLGLYWYPFILIVPGLCLIISVLANFIEKFSVGKFVVSCLNKLGKYTLEIYFVHIFVFEILNKLKDRFNISSLMYFVFSLLSIVLGVFILNRVTKLFVNIIEKCRKSKTIRRKQ